MLQIANDIETNRAVSRPHQEPRSCCSQLQANLTAINFLFQMGEMGYRQVDGQVGRDIDRWMDR